jgi:hypothetical protein
MHTLIENVATDRKGKPCRLVENEDQWHFEQQILRYHSGMNLVITEQDRLDDFIRYGDLTLTEDPVHIHRIKVDLEQAFDWERDRREALMENLLAWRKAPAISYTPVAEPTTTSPAVATKQPTKCKANWPASG